MFCLHPFFPQSWDYNKFKNKIWESSYELNKVVLSFLRQILGVHKKTTNLALMAETGKYPICLKIYCCIVKYWMRLRTTKNNLLHEAYMVNCGNNVVGKKSWMKIIHFLLNYTGTTRNLPHTENEINEKSKTFKSKLTSRFTNWWKDQAIVTGHNKLDYYYKYKKTFQFEKYLDTIPKGTRIYLTRLRLSCHPFPIETGRYALNKTKREDRVCPICQMNELGDEEHYLCRCSNSLVDKTRTNYMTDIRKNNPQMTNFTIKNMIDYSMLLHDNSMQLPLAIYIKEITHIFKELTNLQSKTEVPVFTRSGRQIRKPTKLDL
jgi:hypothetical protein